MSTAPRTGVLGLGLVGGSLLQGLQAAGADPVGFDANEAVTAAAGATGCAVAPDAAALARDCDVLVVCVPPERTAEAVAASLAADPAVVVADAASVKAPVLAAVAAAVAPGELARYVPAHPLAGSERAGWSAAAPDLLRGAVWAACPPAPDAPPDALCALAAGLDPLGARLLVCEPGAHDDAVARTSHAPHVVAMALAGAAASGLDAALTGGAYRDMTRTASADESLWGEILRANRASVGAALRELSAELESLATALERGDEAAVSAAWRTGSDARARVSALRWSEPRWQAERLPLPAWDALLELGRAGRTVRRLGRAAEALELEVAAAG